MLTPEEKRVLEVIKKSPQDTPYSWATSTLKILIKSEVEKFVISKCSTELADGEMLIINVEVGDMPMEAVQVYMKSLKERFEAAGITQTMFVATKHGEGIVTLNKIKENK